MDALRDAFLKKWRYIDEGEGFDVEGDVDDERIPEEEILPAQELGIQKAPAKNWTRVGN